MRTYTPLRYPGGKSRLYSYTKKLISSNFDELPVYAEAFAGGAGLALKLLSKGVVSSVHINDFDYAVYCIWYSLKYHNREFKSLIELAVFSIEEWNRQKEIYLEAKKDNNRYTKLETGFATFYLNRTNRSGIITAGPIGGKRQDGNYKMNCRFNKDELCRIVDNFHNFRSYIHVYNEDAYIFIQEIDKKYDNNCIFYLDPPYVQKGPGLYKNSFDISKHTELRDTVTLLKNKWFMTYDYDTLISELYVDYTMQTFKLSYTVQKSKLGKEYAIFSNNIHQAGTINIPTKMNETTR